MSRFARLLLAIWASALLAQAGPAPADVANPIGDKGPVGWDVYRRLDRLPYLPSGAQTLQYSSFDRTGGDYNRRTGNNNGSGGCLRKGGAGCVVAEDSGPGEIDSIWFTRDGGVVKKMGRMRVAVDGSVVLDAPLQDIVDGKLGAPFIYPLVANAAQSPGGVYVKVPMPYRNSMQVSVESALQYYHVTYRHFADHLGVPTFTPADKANDVLAMLVAAGRRDPKPAVRGAEWNTRVVDVPAGHTVPIATQAGSAAITELRLRLPDYSEAVLSGLRLRIEFDGRESVNSPVGEFFGSGVGPSQVRALMFAADPRPGGWLTTWWPMPFGRNAEVRLENTTAKTVRGVHTEVQVSPNPDWTAALDGGRAGYLSTRSHRGKTTPGHDWMFADEAGHGKFVGVSESIRGVRLNANFAPRVPLFLEGAERVYSDGLLSPQLYGTGTEDFYEGGWYFHNGARYSGPFTGQPHMRSDSWCDYCVAMYRVMLSDAVSYGSGLRFGMEHGKRDLIEADYGSTAFLYTQRGDTTRTGDAVEPADPLSRAVHDYTDSDAVNTALTSNYEGTRDTVATTRTVRVTSRPVAFRLLVGAQNNGVLLRRIADQDRGYQSADVLVDGVRVGRWMQPRANHVHRWLEDSFALPPAATAGKEYVSITLVPSPGAPPWTAARYRGDTIEHSAPMTDPPE
ncbi:MAG: DUF2961 domain-containing protein [Mycobacteriaceae bacterium]|nr:DUF2961 domain-containing protein [Mycobacteriaceae bacterium]